jgi:WD40 repeat protein
VSEDFKEEHFEPQLEIEVGELEIEVGELEIEVGELETEVEELEGIERYLQRKIEKDSGKVRNVVFSPCGNLTAFVYEWRHSHTSNVIQRNTQTRTSTSFSFGYSIACIAYSPDSSRIAVAGWKGTVRILDIQTGLLTSNLGCEQRDDIYCIMYSPDGLWIITGSSGGYLQLCDARNDLAAYRWLGHDSTILDVNFSSNSQWIASCSSDNSVKFWSADTRTLVSVFLGHSDSISSVVFSPDGSHLVTGSDDETVRFWVGSLEADLRTQDPSTPATSVAYSSDGQHLVFGSDDGSVRVCNADTGESELVVSSSSTSPINCVAFSPDGLRFAGATYTGCVTFWDATGNSADTVLVAQGQSVTPIAFSPCGRWLVTSKNNASQLWDASSGQPGQILASHTGSVTSVSFSPNGRHIVSSSYKGSIRIWEIGFTEPREIVTGIDSWISTVAYSPVAPQIAASFGDVVQIWDEQSGNSLQRLKQTSDVSTFAFSSCGSWIAIGCCGFVSLWNYGLKDLRWEWRQAVVVKGFIGDVVALA